MVCNDKVGLHRERQHGSSDDRFQAVCKVRLQCTGQALSTCSCADPEEDALMKRIRQALLRRQEKDATKLRPALRQFKARVRLHGMIRR